MSGVGRLARPPRRALIGGGRSWSLWVVLALLGAVGVFATVVRVDRVVVGRGQLVPVDERSDVRLSMAGIVAEV